MRFIVDAQLPPALARLLTTLGHDARHVVDIGLRDAEDSSIWTWALRHDAVILTKDEDFRHRTRQSRHAPAVVWLRMGNTSRASLLRWFEVILPQILNLLQQGDRFVEVR